jgi:Spy/CpxP family protein refolding chaperone
MERKGFQVMKRMISLAILAASVLLAQDPAGAGLRARRAAGGRQAGAGPARVAAVRDALDLTDAQIQQLRELRKSQMEALKPTLDQMRTKNDALRKEMETDNPNPATVGQLTVEIKTLRKTISDGQADRVAKAQQILTPEQQDKLKALNPATGTNRAFGEAAMLGLVAPPNGPGMMRGGPGMMGRGPMMQREGRRTPPPQQQQ